MKSIKKLFALVFTLGIFAFLAACSSSSGIKGNMEYTSTTTTIKITTTFAENDKLKSSSFSIKEYSLDSSGNETFKETKDLSFSNDIYTRANPVEFKGLTKDSKYLYKLYVKSNNYTEEIATLEAKTSSTGDSEDNSIEIKSTDDFNNISNNLTAHYVLMDNLDFKDITLSTAITATSSERFKGTFDGNGYTIKNLTFTSAANIGLFPYTDGATIKNLTIDTVVADFSTGRATANIGALIGGAEATKVENVTVKNVTYTIQGNSSAELNVGGVVGNAKRSTFSSVNAENVSINFTRSRLKVNAGLFAGILSEKSVGKITIEDNEVSLLADKCSASGKIEAVAYYPSSEGYTHIGGFAGDVSSSSLLQDSYSNVEIKVSKDTTESYSNKYSLAVGGFVGANNVGSMKINKCLAKAAINVTSGSEDDNLTTSSATDKYFACIGGFAGHLHKYISSISNSIYMSSGEGIVVVAKETQEITEDGQTSDVKVLFTSNTVGKNDDSQDKVTDLVEWSDTLDISSFGENVKKFIESL